MKPHRSYCPTVSVSIGLSNGMKLTFQTAEPPWQLFPQSTPRVMFIMFPDARVVPPFLVQAVGDDLVIYDEVCRVVVPGPETIPDAPEEKHDDNTVRSSDDEVPLDTNRDLMAEAEGLKHLLAHVPMNPHGQACPSANLANKHERTRKRDPSSTPTKFEEQVTPDHLVASRSDRQGYDGSRYAIVM